MKTIKEQAKLAYNQSAEIWHASRNTKPADGGMSDLMKQNRPHYFVEKPAMEKLLPNLKGKKVLCVGCGSGEEVAMIANNGAESITGIDISENLIAIAQREFPPHKFYAMDVENLDFADNSFDYIYSSLVFDYFKDWKKLLGEISRVLKPGGTLQFSNIHPVRWSAEKSYDESTGRATGLKLGFSAATDTHPYEVYGNYLGTVMLNEKWINKINLTFYSRPISAMVNDLINAGFTIRKMVEPMPIEETKIYDPDYYELGSKIPSQVIFVCEKAIYKT
jgi:ubiquinone/menaquinone biosynthesis C-methylase UbiE